MKLGTLRQGGRDGTLVVVRKDGKVYVPATDIAPTLQAALDQWRTAAPRLVELAGRLERGEFDGQPLVAEDFASPLPRAYEWLDGSAFLNHVRLVRKARGADLPPNLLVDPLVYQGGSGAMLAPTDPIPFQQDDWGLDFESEICAILGDTPMGVPTADAAPYIRLFCLANDVTLRNLVPAELAKNFGFLQSKPATAFSPFAVTPDELGDAWRAGRVHQNVRTIHNGVLVGNCDAGQMHFSFFDLIAHITRTRRLTAGTILGSGTVSNAERTRGVSCLAERRILELLETGEARTPYLKPGDRVQIQALNDAGEDVFGTIDQKVAVVV